MEQITQTTSEKRLKGLTEDNVH